LSAAVSCSPLCITDRRGTAAILISKHYSKQ
jgi:hypothetical protein